VEVYYSADTKLRLQKYDYLSLFFYIYFAKNKSSESAFRCMAAETAYVFSHRVHKYNENGRDEYHNTVSSPRQSLGQSTHNISKATYDSDCQSSCLVWMEKLSRNAIYLSCRKERIQTVSSNVLYIHLLYPSFTVFSKRFYPLYLLPLQQRPLNHVPYMQIPILEIFFIFYTYVFVILSNVLYIF
jgi:hypothetical protein